MGKGGTKRTRQYGFTDTEGSEDEIQLSKLNIDVLGSDEGEVESEFEVGPEFDFPEVDSEDETSGPRGSDADTLEGSIPHPEFKSGHQEASDEDSYPSSDTELSDEDEAEELNSELEKWGGMVSPLKFPVTVLADQFKGRRFPVQLLTNPRLGREYVTRPGKGFPAKLPEIDPVYDSDSSTEETQNTVGNVPMHWYDDYPHIGYTVDGKRIFKPATKDELDRFLDNVDDPDAGKTVLDVVEQKEVRLTDEELGLIQRLVAGKMGPEGYDPYPELVEYFSGKVRETPLTGGTEPKRRFIPSVAENRRVMALVKAIRRGEIVGRRPVEVKPKFYDVWNAAGEGSKLANYIPPPKKPLPTNAESYNPPEEYLFDEEELKAWKAKDHAERRPDFIPQKYPSLRAVPAYARSYQEAFRRCLDLYLNPRMRKSRLELDPDSLVPKLPDPKDLQPFPTRLAVVFEGHQDKVRTFSIDPTGQYLVSGSDDGTVKVWEVSTGRCLQTIALSGVIHSVAWNPNPSLALIAATAEDKVVLFTPHQLCDEAAVYRTEALVDAGFASPAAQANPTSTRWLVAEAHHGTEGVGDPSIGLPYQYREAGGVASQGDYFATVAPKDGASAILIHQLTKRQSQRPFRKLKGAVQKVAFHPTRPHFVIATQRFVRVYNLQLQSLEKTLLTGSLWVSSLDIHPQGDNLIVGSYDRRLNWFDLDLSSKPYKTLRFHKEAIRSVGFHPRYPLFASCSDDGSLQVFHGMVYNDLMQNPLLVPLKILRGHQIDDSLGVLHLEFHPHQPWLLSSGSDGRLCLFA
ncbi:Ribosome biogenesis protein erb1 [Massospora cicadina]|nr:Ribosome biogenesis protein erb1 [Massospora cicadina]